jgi:hypothetical protein
VDRNGSVWVADVGRHQVLKFTASGKLIMAIGKKMIPGSGPRELCKPTQVRCADVTSAHALGVAVGGLGRAVGCLCMRQAAGLGNRASLPRCVVQMKHQHMV